MNKVLFISSDHNANAARAYIVELLGSWGYDVRDVGMPYDVKADYPYEAAKVATAVIHEPGSRGILMCGTGTGMLIMANRYPLIRAGLATDRATAKLMREHNDCNVLVMGQWRTPLGQMDEILKTFLETQFQGGRHVPRVKMLEEFP